MSGDFTNSVAAIVTLGFYYYIFLCHQIFHSTSKSRKVQNILYRNRWLVLSNVLALLHTAGEVLIKQLIAIDLPWPHLITQIALTALVLIWRVNDFLFLETYLTSYGLCGGYLLGLTGQLPRTSVGNVGSYGDSITPPNMTQSTSTTETRPGSVSLSSHYEASLSSASIEMKSLPEPPGGP